jgi:hypothetical protein
LKACVGHVEAGGALLAFFYFFFGEEIKAGAEAPSGINLFFACIVTEFTATAWITVFNAEFFSPVKENRFSDLRKYLLKKIKERASERGRVRSSFVHSEFACLLLCFSRSSSRVAFSASTRASRSTPRAGSSAIKSKFKSL